jgi:N-dimethylarginine dimethylaminohydrolase
MSQAITYPRTAADDTAESPFEAFQAARRRRDWRLEDLPFADRGIDDAGWAYQDLDYRHVYPEVWGRQCGENGIGRLREVALSRISPVEVAVYDERYPFHEDPAWLESQGLLDADIGRLQEEQAAYAELLEQHGVKVHWIDWGEAPMSAFGPMQAMWAASDCWVTRGGIVVQKTGWHPFGFGRSEWMARWLQHHVGIPILYTVHGKGVHEPSTTIWLAEDIWVTALSAAYNEEGHRQVESVVRRTCGVEDLEVHVVRLTTDRFMDRRAGLGAHLTLVLSSLDLDTVLAYRPGLDAQTLRWLRHKGFKIVDVGRDEQLRYIPTNTIPLEPGVVFMAGEATETIAAVRRAGIEVIAVPNAEFNQIGGALHCRTLRIARDPGPYRNA